MKNLNWLLAVAVSLSGCASDVMKTMVGKDISQVVAQYGPPANSFKAKDGQTAFQWRMQNSVVMPTTTNFNAYGTSNYVGGSNYVNGSNYVSGSATTYGGYMGEQVCFYTLYARQAGKERWLVTGFEPPRPDCE